MKIVFLSRYQIGVQRGVENFVSELSKRLSKKIEVDVFAGDDSDSLTKILKGKYDVVIPTNGRMQSLKVSVGRFIGGYKMLISGHSGIGRDDLWNILMTRPDVFVALTSKMEEWAKKWSLGCEVIKIPNGIDLDKFNPEGQKMQLNLEKPIILCVGALHWYKHHERVIEAVAKLGKGSLIIVGEGEEKERLMELGKQKLAGRLKILKLNYEQMPQLYRSVDLFTLPSWEREAFGLVYLEALASNLSVVAPDDQSRKEIIGDGGILVDVSDFEKYAEALEKALEKNWGNLPREQAKKFSWDIVASKYEDALNKLND